MKKFLKKDGWKRMVVEGVEYKYYINKDGRIQHMGGEKPLTPWREYNKSSRLRIRVKIQGKMFEVAPLIYSTFNAIEYKECRRKILFKDRNRENVKLTNLWYSEIDAQHIETVEEAKAKIKAITEIYKYIVEGKSDQEISDRLYKGPYKSNHVLRGMITSIREERVYKTLIKRLKKEMS